MRLLLLLALLLAAPARADHVPFAPPEGEALAYRVEIATSQRLPGVADAQSAAGLPTFRFTRGPGDGWTLIVTPGVDEVSGNAPEQALAIARAVATAGPPLPMEVRLDRQGNFLDLANADSLMAEVRAAFARLRAALPEGLPAEAVDAIATTMVGLSRDAFVEQALATFQFAFETAVEGLPLDTPTEVRERMPLAMLGGAEGDFAMTVIATRLSPGRVRITVTGSVDAAALATQLEAFATRLLETQPCWRDLPEAEKTKQRAELTEALRRTEQTYDTRIEVDLATGLPVAATQVRRTRAPAPAGTTERAETLSLTRLP
jgi:hypothetical protein